MNKQTLISKNRPHRGFYSALGLGAVVVAGSLLAGACSSWAQAAPEKPVEKPKGWESVASVGLTLTHGNSENLLFAAGFNTARKWPHDELLFGVGGGYGESTDKTKEPETRTTTAQFAKGFGQWNHLFDQKLYAGVRLDGLYDQVAGIDYRFIGSPLVGYYFIKEPNMFLAGELGPSFVAENLAGEPAKQYMGLRVGDRFEYKFSDRAKLWETAEWVPQIDDFNNWILTAEVGVSAALNKSLDLRLVLQDQYNNNPAKLSNGQDRDKNDLKIIAGIGYKF